MNDLPPFLPDADTKKTFNIPDSVDVAVYPLTLKGAYRETKRRLQAYPRIKRALPQLRKRVAEMERRLSLNENTMQHRRDGWITLDEIVYLMKAEAETKLEIEKKHIKELEHEVDVITIALGNIATDPSIQSIYYRYFAKKSWTSIATSTYLCERQLQRRAERLLLQMAMVLYPINSD